MNKAYLLNWSPKKWDIKELEKVIEEYKSGNKVVRWSIGNRKNINKGDCVYITKQGNGSVKGLFALGKIISEEVFQAQHFEKGKEGKTANYVNIEIDYIVNPNQKVIISREELLETFPKQNCGKA